MLGRQKLRRMTLGEVLHWADLYRARTGRWPSVTSGVVPSEEHHTWRAIDRALRRGSRGLPGGSSLAKVLVLYRHQLSPLQLPRPRLPREPALSAPTA